MRQARVVVVGSSNADMVTRMPRAPEAGETVLCDSYEVIAGGKGANQAVAAARMGAAVTFVACLGNDSLGYEARDRFQNEGIDTRFVELLAEVPTGTAFIWVEESGENRIVVASGANGRLTPEHVETAAEAIKQADVLLCQLETPLPAVQRALELARASGVRTILNPAPAAQLPSALLATVDILTPNLGEAARILGMQNAGAYSREDLSRQLLDQGVRLVLMTLGERGCLIHDPGEPPWIAPAPRVDVVDTTAAGDTFNGAFAALIGSGAPLEDAVRTAVDSASLACTRPGAQPSIPFHHEVNKLMVERNGWRPSTYG